MLFHIQQPLAFIRLFFFGFMIECFVADPGYLSRRNCWLVAEKGGTLSQGGGSESTAHFNKRKASSRSILQRFSYKAQLKCFSRRFMHKNNSIHQNKSFQNFTPKPLFGKIY